MVAINTLDENRRWWAKDMARTAIYRTAQFQLERIGEDAEVQLLEIILRKDRAALRKLAGG